MRIGIGGIWHETHTFSSVATTMDDFKACACLRGDELVTSLRGTNTEIGGMLDAAVEIGFEAVPALYAGATPSGIVEGRTFLGLLEELIDRLKAAAPLDGVLLSLHGAMVAEGYPDAEGEIIARVREALGPIPIMATLDLHANISETMVKHADVLVGYDTYPHVDFADRGREAAHLMAATVQGKIRPYMVMRKPAMMPPVQRMLTDEPPMKDLIELAHAAEREEGVLSVTIAGGFPYADVECVGMSAVVVTDSKPALAEETADRIVAEMRRRAERFLVELVPVDIAVQRALASERAPVILVDSADNIGGGAPGDGTVVLESLLRHKAAPSLVCIADAEAVAVAARAGVGAVIETAVGGKVDKLHGAPVVVRGRVRHLFDGQFINKGTYMTGRRVNMGKSAVIDCDGITILLSERKTPPFDQEQVRCAGLDPRDFRIIVVKSAVAWRAAFGDVAADVFEVNAPGLCAADLRHFDYKNVRRPIFPLDFEGFTPAERR